VAFASSVPVALCRSWGNTDRSGNVPLTSDSCPRNPRLYLGIVKFMPLCRKKPPANVALKTYTHISSLCRWYPARIPGPAFAFPIAAQPART
jgi:hypothetical protein